MSAQPSPLAWQQEEDLPVVEIRRPGDGAEAAMSVLPACNVCGPRFIGQYLGRCSACGAAAIVDKVEGVQRATLYHQPECPNDGLSVRAAMQLCFFSSVEDTVGLPAECRDTHEGRGS